MPAFYFIRHAKAGSRGDWDLDDRIRALSKGGFKQAEALVSILERYPISAVFTSPYLRCVQTVEPLARSRGLALQETPALAEGAGLRGAMRFVQDPMLGDAALCTHGDVIEALVDELVSLRLVHASQSALEKGSIWALEVEAGSPVRARYISPP